MTREQRREVLLAPLLIWAALLALLLATIVYAYWGGAPMRPSVGIAVGIAKAGIIALFFMQLRNAAGIVRLAAVAGVVWASFLYLFSFADFLTR